MPRDKAAKSLENIHRFVLTVLIVPCRKQPRTLSPMRRRSPCRERLRHPQAVVAEARSPRQAGRISPPRRHKHSCPRFTSTGDPCLTPARPTAATGRVQERCTPARPLAINNRQVRQAPTTSMHSRPTLHHTLIFADSARHYPKVSLESGPAAVRGTSLRGAVSKDWDWEAYICHKQWEHLGRPRMQQQELR